jgi:hypothetical protein
MKNITVTITDDVYTATRVWAAQRGTSVSRIVQHMLSILPDLGAAEDEFPAPAAPAPAPAPDPERTQTL